MTSDWETFAQRDPEWYVQTPGTGHRPFFEHGEQLVAEMLERVEDLVPSFGHAIDIGCGPGRLAIPLSRRFESVTGVDIAPTMLDRLAENCRSRDIVNVSGCLPADPWDVAGSADLVYSLQVLQHIPDASVISDYLERTAVALKPDGVAYLHFDSRPTGAAYRLRALLPDAVLPRSWRRGIRRIRRPPQKIAELLTSARLRPLREFNSGTADHVLIVARAG